MTATTMARLSPRSTARLRSDGLSRRVSLDKSGYDVAVGLIDGKLAFSATGGQFDGDGPGSSPRLTLPDNAGAATATVASAIDRIAKVMALQRMAGVGAEEKFGLGGEILLIKAKPDAVRDGLLFRGSRRIMTRRQTAGDTPRLGACDILSIAMENGGKKPLDVTILLVGADFSITPIWPADGADNRIATGEARTIDLVQNVPDQAPASEQRLILVTVPGVGKSHTAFDNLGQEGLRAVPGEDAGPAAEARDLLAVGLNEMDRAATSQPPRIEEEMSISVKPFYVGE